MIGFLSNVCSSLFVRCSVPTYGKNELAAERRINHRKASTEIWQSVFVKILHVVWHLPPRFVTFRVDNRPESLLFPGDIENARERFVALKENEGASVFCPPLLLAA
jgi:hypothetical protein